LLYRKTKVEASPGFGDPLFLASPARRLALSLSKWLRKISTADFIPVRAKSQKNAY